VRPADLGRFRSPLVTSSPGDGFVRRLPSACTPVCQRYGLVRRLYLLKSDMENVPEISGFEADSHTFESVRMNCFPIFIARPDAEPITSFYGHETTHHRRCGVFANSGMCRG
jgi:hypothetical protein